MEEKLGTITTTICSPAAVAVSDLSLNPLSAAHTTNVLTDTLQAEEKETSTLFQIWNMAMGNNVAKGGHQN